MVKNQKMNRIVLYITAAMIMTACSHDIVRETDFNVTLAPENTYVAGEPVSFLIGGEVDYLLFFSGEEGCVYGQEGNTGTSIKNIQNYLHSYEYVWEEPGTYTVTFFGTNATYMSSSTRLHTLTVTILERLP